MSMCIVPPKVTAESDADVAWSKVCARLKRCMCAAAFPPALFNQFLRIPQNS